MRSESVFAILKPAVGPSSSHTLGPIVAARRFAAEVAAAGLPGGRLRATLQGSLALTGKGHLTDLAVVAGLAGFDPEGDPHDGLAARARAARAAGGVVLGGRTFALDPDRDVVFDALTGGLPHPNTLRLAVVDGEEARFERVYLSVGGGRVLAPGEGLGAGDGERPTMDAAVDACLRDNVDLAQLALASELEHHGRTRAEVEAGLDRLWERMEEAVERGLRAEGYLPGRLQLERRAGALFAAMQRDLRRWRALSRESTLATVYAIAIAEENAAGGRVVTAPTCGSAGVLPAVLLAAKERFFLGPERLRGALLVAGLVGGIVARNASIAGAEVGCQGEIGVASAMAAAALCHLLEGSVPQVECAAEIALEHHLGLTCDPVHGLVQIPCIERNAAGAVAAMNAANLALLGRGRHLVSFDTAVETMRRCGRDMRPEYKETALGGLAVELPRQR